MHSISILTTSDFPYGGAPENFVREMVNGIKEFSSNVDVNIVRFWGNRNKCFNNTTFKCSNYLFKKPVKREFLKFFELIFQILYSPIFLIKVKYIHKTKILLLYGLDRAYIIVPILLFSKLLGIKCYRIITEIYQKKDYAYSWWRKPLVFFNSIQIKYFDRFLDGLIVLSKYLKELCITNGVKECKICIIPHFINFKNHTNDKQINIRRGSFDLVYSGSITIENGILDLIDAFLIFKSNHALIDTTLTFLGERNYDLIPEDKERQLEKYNIKFKGKLRKDDVFLNMYQASLLVNPRRKSILAESGFPTKIGEYFSTKIPVLSTKVGDLKFYFKHAIELYFAPENNPQLLSEMITYIYINKEERIQVGINGYNWGYANLNNINNAGKLLMFLK